MQLQLRHLVVLSAVACSRPLPPAPVAAPVAAVAPAGVAASPTPVQAEQATAEPLIEGPLRATAPVATVNGKPITADKFNVELDKLVGNGAKIPADRLRRIAHNIIAKLVEAELRDQAIAEHHIELTQAEVDDAWREFTQRFTGDDGKLDEERMKDELRHSRSSVDQVKDQLRQQRLGKKLVEKMGAVDVTEVEVKQFYDENPSAWVEPASRDVRAIVVRVGNEVPQADKDRAEKKAKEAYEALKAGGDFELLAKQYADGPQPPIHLVRNASEPELERVAFELKVGDIAPPIHTRWGWYVLRLIEKNEQRVRTLAEVRAEIRKTITARKNYLEERRIMQELRRKANVVETLPF